MTGKVVHFEVPYDDADRASSFYREVFGWQVQPIPEMNYTSVATGPAGDQGMPSEPGYIGGGMFERMSDIDRPVITIEVDNMDDALKSVSDHGGSQVGEQMKVADMGIAAYFKDSEGNLMGLWQTTGGG
jgi:predicted enzyme related to lactoylglutathione lyase